MKGGQGAAAQTVADISAGPPSKETRWVVDMVHSQVDFGIRHLVGRVRGNFARWYGVLSTEEDGWKVGIVNVSVETTSLSTGNAYRDADLRSDRFFAVKRYPKMTFQGSGFAATDSTDADGHERIAFEATGTVDRRDFDISWNESIPALS